MAFPYAAEDIEDKLCQLIDARIEAIKLDILIGRQSTTNDVLARLPIADEDEARAVLWNAVVAGSSAVGMTNAGAVELAIFQVAEALSLGDLADMEQMRQESIDDYRIERAIWARSA